jgi:AcrR family transcriptional regulator
MAISERPLRRDAERNRQRILDAARELFAERGLGVTLNDVAHHAGVGVGTVYRRFPDKDGLIEELFEQRLREMVALSEQALEDPDPWHALTGFLEQALELQARDRGFKEIMIGAPGGMERLAMMRARIWPIVGVLADGARETGQLRVDFEAQDGPILALMLGTVIDCARDIDPNLWRRYLQIVVQGLRANPDKPEPLEIAPLPPDRVQDFIAAWQPPRRYPTKD